MIYNMRRRKKKVSLKWHFNETIVPAMTSTSKKTFTANFKSADSRYTGMKYNTKKVGNKYVISELKYMERSLGITVWDGSRGWVNEFYQTVEFEKEPTGELLTFLQANATPL